MSREQLAAGAVDGVQSPRPLRILFFMRAANYDRHFEAVLRELLGRRHTVHVALDVAKKGRSGSTDLFDRMQAEEGDLTYGLVPERRKVRWLKLGRQLRFGVDFLRYLDPRFADAHVLRVRAEARAPRLVVRMTRLPGLRRPTGAKLLNWLLRVPEQALPIDPALTAMIDDFAPDLVLVTPLVGLGSPQGDYVRAARARGVPTAFMVASWDNLTNKGIVRDPTDLTVVWNREQLRECVELHGLSEEHVCVAGAHTYDHWFEWMPSTTREEFCERVGLRPDRPTVLYVCSSGFIAPDETAFIARWIGLLRGSPDARLRDANVLIRPHPAHSRIWQEANIFDPGRVAIWPREGASPTTAQTKADYFDSIHHASVVVGVNTSALVESAIVGRPVLSLVTSDFERTQDGTLHFHYLKGPDGLLTVARTEQEHIEQLTRALQDEVSGRRRCERFVEHFLRPHGRAEAAAPRVVDALEQLAERRPDPVRARLRHAIVRGALALPLHVGELALRRAPKRSWKEPLRVLRPPRDSRDPLRILFCFDHPGSLLHYDETIHGLAARGHRVHIAFAATSKYEQALDVLAREDASIVVHEKSPRRSDRYAFAVRASWALMDLAHYLHPRLGAAHFSRAKWRELAPPVVGLKWLKRADKLTPRRFGLIVRCLRWTADSAPSSKAIDRFLRKIDPDVVLLSPLITRSGHQSDILKSARALGIPSAMCLSSWDNLTSKGRIREIPDRVIVWNETQRREAVEFHDVESERIVTTGAQQFDRWFDREPSTDRPTFLGRLGLPPDQPLLLFVGSTRQAADRRLEPDFVGRWLEALRASDDPLLRDASVLIRPHPTAMDRWDDASFEGLGNVVVAHRDRPLPVGTDARSDYFDALYHCAAVVGINSTAMVEATVVGRPVHTVTLPEFRALQHDLMHFHYLRETHGGFLREAADLDEHVRLLGEDLRAPEAGDARRRGFVASFVRPHGFEVAATDRLMNEIEQVAAIVAQPRRANVLVRLLGRGVALAIGIPDAFLGVVHRSIRRLIAAGRRPVVRLERRVAGTRLEPLAGPLRRINAALDRADENSRSKLKAIGALRTKDKPVKRLKKRLKAAAAERAGVVEPGKTRVLFFVKHGGFVRNFQSFLTALAEAGHEIEIVLQDWDRRWLAHHPVKKLARQYPNVAYSKEPKRLRRRRARFLLALRRAIDHLHYLRPEFDATPRLRARVERRSPRALRLLAPALRSTVVRRLLYRLLAWVERHIPVDPAVRAFIEERRPDVVMVTPLIYLSSSQHDYVRAARRLGIPSVAGIASWDNLTTKGTFREVPDVVAVWNETQRSEAVDFHGIPPERIVVTGAHTYDHWFDWQPATAEEEFRAAVGLPGDKPFVLYVCSSQFVAPEEVSFVTRWLEQLRSTPGLEELGVLVRPHPQNAAQWQDVDLAGYGAVAIWPREGADPVEAEAKRAFYDSMHHCRAVVGINTSALIEAAIVGRPVLTVTDESFAETQRGTLHFAYLAEGERPLLAVARTIEEHLQQLAGWIGPTNGNGNHSRNAAFLKSFVRPHGLSGAAAPRLLAIVERLAQDPRSVKPKRDRPASARRRAHLLRRLRPLVTRPVRRVLTTVPVPYLSRRLAARDARLRALAAEQARLKKAAAKQEQRDAKAARAVAKEAAREAKAAKERAKPREPVG